MVRILFEPLGRVGEARAGESILDVAVRLGVGLRSDCGGSGSCGKCRVMIEGGGVSCVEAVESKRLSAEELVRSYRLACAAKILPNARKITIRVPPESLLRARKFMGDGVGRRVRLDPLILQHIDVVRSRRGALLGLAVDVGTSRVTARLIDLTRGATLATESVENPQIAYGENLITRAAYAQRSDQHRLKLRAELQDTINALIAKFTDKNGEDILQAVLVGNTVMHHFLLGLDTSRLTRAPFTPTRKEMTTLRGVDSGLNINPDAIVSLLPNVDAFVGADAVADVIAGNLLKRVEPTLLLDIGTNTELLLRAGGEVLACSCASGPAFEGEHIEHGMKAVEGAIERVRMRRGVAVFETIGSTTPVGICGSGIVDAVAELLRCGLINKVGRFTAAATPNLVHTGNQKKFIIANAGESGTGSPITLSEGDINEIILAKAAISAAAEVLMGMKGVEARDLRRVLVAGAFGGHLNRVNAKRIGLLPDVEGRRISFIGNSALEGASMALKSRKILGDAETIARETKYVELASNPDFDARFRKSLRLP
jgi:uncharacterized 2Fe-2S/4Fe-4S cluster protein (DUF4445 family)